MFQNKKPLSLYIELLSKFPRLIDDEESYVRDNEIALRLPGHCILYLTKLEPVTSTFRQQVLTSGWNIRVETVFGGPDRTLPLTPNNQAGDGPLTEDEIIDRMEDYHEYVRDYRAAY